MNKNVLCVASFVATSALALPSPALAFRTSADLPDFAESGQSRIVWELGTDETVAFVVRTEGAFVQTRPLLDAVSIVGALDGALRDLACNRMRIRAAESPSSAVGQLGNGSNEIRLIDSNAWIAAGFAPDLMAFTDLRYLEGIDGQLRIVEADILVNEGTFDFGGDANASSTPLRDGRAILTHELLHALGLLHPCEHDGSRGAPLCSTDATFATRLMWPDYRPATQQSMSADELLAMCFLYPRFACDVACARDTACVENSCGSVCGATVCPASATCEDGACRRSCEGVFCASSQSCVDGLCLERCDGDVCGVGEVCGHGIARTCGPATCSGAGEFCTTCGESTPCPSGSVCVDEDGTGHCHVADGRVGSSCRSDSGCDIPGRCIGNICRVGWGHDGDPCASPSDCSGELCVDGHCSRPCDVPGDCEFEFASCSEGVCDYTRRQFGASCERPSECSSNLCLIESVFRTSSCTRSCSLEDDDCPDAFRCSLVGAAPVCVPDYRTGSGACSIDPGRASGGSSFLFTVCALAILRGSRRRNLR